MIIDLHKETGEQIVAKLQEVEQFRLSRCRLCGGKSAIRADMDASIGLRKSIFVVGCTDCPARALAAGIEETLTLWNGKA